MQSIYLKAYQTVIFLGNPSFNTDHVFDMIQQNTRVEVVKDHLTPLVEDVVQGPSLSPNNFLADTSRTILHHDKAYSYSLSWLRGSFTHTVAAGIRELLQNPYWNRTWILQELAAPDVPTFILCGQKKVHIEAFEMLLEHVALSLIHI